DDVAVEAHDLGKKLLAKSVHDRHHRDQGEDAEQDAEEREPREHRDEPFPASRPQVAQRQHPLKGCERARIAGRLAHQAPFLCPRLGRVHANTRRALTSSVRRLSAASGAKLMRSPDLRSFSSTSPLFTPFGPTTSWNGSPIRSMVANLAPARS